ncbi:MAG: M50 family metallopeptidase [Coriobacteriales bacterium]|nr:M50 family metallopeptidase [Coriobacteriales bacterium]
MSNVVSIVFFGVLMLSLIVFVHELGHFSLARLFGVRVTEFMIGLPGPNLGFTAKGTRFGITPFLLGGYAKIAGMEGGRENPNLARALAWMSEQGTASLEQVQDAEHELGFNLEEALDILDIWGSIKRVRKGWSHYHYETIAAGDSAAGQPRPLADPAAVLDAERQLTYRALPWWKRVVILAGGVLYNLVFAVIVITAILMFIGTEIPTTTFASIVDDSPAAEAGIVAGDSVVELDGVAITSWEQFSTALSAMQPGDEVRLVVDHDGTRRSVDVQLADNEGRPMLGVVVQTEHQGTSFVSAFTTSVGYIGLVAQFIVQLFNPNTFSEVVSQSTSVIGISVEAKNAASAGFLPFIFLAAALSISVGLMNLLPLPPLDGGKIVVETIERLTGRIVPVKVVNGITVAAMAALLLLFVYVTNQDIHRYFLGG